MTPFGFGNVKFWDGRKNFGFIIVDGSEDIYFDREALAPGVTRLETMQRVRFRKSVSSSMKRAIAVDVRPAPSVEECLQSMQALRRHIDDKIPHANVQLAELRFLLDELQQLTSI